ncbi:DUF4232 domain-containing protein [Streptomyces gamaensis]|uniref:DUF4232 domain-containing protein n=1 Tax=Streptomyces gamaensis TaxID=1763542 RepID=A0ABW0Z0H9_9ACTN
MRTALRKAATVTAAALAAATVATATHDASAATAATPTCRTQDLRASLTDSGHQIGMSHQGTLLRLTNASSHSCALRGYPGLQLEDAGHRPLTTNTHWGSTYFAPDPGKKTLILGPGRSVEADLVWAHADAPVMVEATYLEITPPASTSHLTVPFQQIVTNGDLSVTALAYRIDV